jgi:GR25 family glycosyltransferase involved in LPS biosynthesis
MEKYNCLIIHNYEHSPDRHENVKKLQSIFPNNHIIKSIFPDDLTDEDKEFALNPKQFHAMPVLYKFPERILGRYCCYLSHLKALEYAYHNELHNVIIFEDDAILYEDNFNFESFIKKKSINLITWLGGCINEKNNYIYCLHSYYIPSYGFIGFLLNEIEDSDNKRAIDSMFVNIIQKKNINYGYFDVFRQMQNTYSYIDNTIKEKPGTWVKNCKNAT